MLKRAKLFTLSLAARTGLSALVLDSGWRRGRLLILAYHGFSQQDEHLWDPAFYMPPEVFRRRLEYLRSRGCNVLPLSEALSRLYSATLPDRSVVLTIDDGTYDAFRLACPILREFGYPASIYLTTYYSDNQCPVFDPMCSYLFWKARGKHVELPEISGAPLLLDEAGLRQAAKGIMAYATDRGLSGKEKNSLLSLLAGRMALDYEGICRARILHIMTREEARELARVGFDIQLHTHRHRLSLCRERFQQEIAENARRVDAIRSSPAHHFCYPGGVYMPDFEETLSLCGIESVATCWPGMATRSTPPLRLPRLVDSFSLTDLEFNGWLSGEASILPRRRFVSAEGQLLQ